MIRSDAVLSLYQKCLSNYVSLSGFSCVQAASDSVSVILHRRLCVLENHPQHQMPVHNQYNTTTAHCEVCIHVVKVVWVR
jgi:hypothetical protein